MPIDWLVSDPARVLKTIVLGTLSYAALIAMLRLSGKRTLSQMNAFDFVVTVALGSTLSAILVSPEVSLAQGLTALGLLVALQFVVTFVAVRRPPITERVVKNRPRLLLYKGQLLDDALRDERVVPAEVYQAIRQNGFLGVDSVHAVILETDGGFSVVGEAPPGEPTALGDMQPPQQQRDDRPA